MAGSANRSPFHITAGTRAHCSSRSIARALRCTSLLVLGSGARGTRCQRIMVNLAGFFHDVVIAGAASILGLLVAEPLFAALCWQLAFLAYLGVLVNLTPLLELDGYYVLVDLLDRPSLRPRALSWLGQELLPTLRSRGVAGLRGHYTELVYGIASLLYIAFIALPRAACAARRRTAAQASDG